MKPEDDHPRFGNARVRRSLSIDAAPGALLEAWRDPDVQAQVMAPLATFVSGDARLMRWRIDLPLDRIAEVESRETHLDSASSRYSSRTVQRPRVTADLEFSVRPAPADFGTEATLAADYALPGGVLADAAARLFGAAPDLLAGTVLRRLKALIETGEIPTLRGNPSARERGDEAGT